MKPKNKKSRVRKKDCERVCHHQAFSNTTKPIACVASTARFPTLKLAPLKSIGKMSRVADSTKVTTSLSASSHEISPRNMFGIPPFVSIVSFKTVLDFFHIPNLSNASLDEAIFLHILHGSLATQARMLAAI